MLEIIGRVRCNVLISGGTGSGKTTLLNCLTGSIDDDERIITCEDSAELQLQQPHVVRLETRPPNLEGEGEITMRDLVKNCLRMRPERIIVGEVRGPEAFDLLQAMNTGHDGSMGTLHANSPREAISRLESMIMMGGYALPIKTIREMITGSIDVIVQASRLRDGSRKITHITEVLGMEGEVVTLQNLIVYEITGEDADGKLLGRHRSTGIARPRFWERAEYYGETERLARRSPGIGNRGQQRQSARRSKCLAAVFSLISCHFWRRWPSAVSSMRWRTLTFPATGKRTVASKASPACEGASCPALPPKFRAAASKSVADSSEGAGGPPESREKGDDAAAAGDVRV